MKEAKKNPPKGLKKVIVRPVEFRRTIANYDRRLPPVVSTPSMIGQMEVAAALLLQPFLPKGAISVGTHINVSHVGAATLGCFSPGCANAGVIAPHFVHSKQRMQFVTFTF